MGSQLSTAELNRRAHEVIEAIDAETGNRTAHSARVGRLYHLARDIQHAQANGAREMTVYRVVAFLATVLLNSYRPTVAR